MTPEQAADFINRHGNAGRDPDGLLQTKPSEDELKAAKERCHAVVDGAFYVMRHHHQMDIPTQR